MTFTIMQTRNKAALITKFDKSINLKTPLFNVFKRKEQKPHTKALFNEILTNATIIIKYRNKDTLQV